MHQIVLDTETTGLSHEQGHRLIEIGCVKIIDRKITNQHFHTYINPQRKVDEGAFRVHGIATEFLYDKPTFKEILPAFLDFVNDSEVIIHNAPFDTGFINAELNLVKSKKKLHDYCVITDSLALARTKHPGQRNSLDALCKRYDIDNSHRQLHGALLDAEILALVYLAMTGGQGSLFNEEAEEVSLNRGASSLTASPLSSSSPVILPTAMEIEQHEAFIQFLKQQSGQDRW